MSFLSHLLIKKFFAGQGPVPGPFLQVPGHPPTVPRSLPCSSHFATMPVFSFRLQVIGL